MPVNLKDVKRYTSRPNEFGGPTETMPEPIVLDSYDGAECFEVEEVLSERDHQRRRQVLVKWTGVDIINSTWEPIGNIPSEFVDRFRGRQVDVDGDS